jgi:hypothetical protein
VQESIFRECAVGYQHSRLQTADRQGRVIILCGMAWYEFEADPVDQTTGLLLCRLTKRNEEVWQETRASALKYGVAEWLQPEPTNVKPKWTITPWLGQECGFLLASDSADVMDHHQFTRVEFGSSTISHFKKPKDFGLKVFVTGVFSGRIRQLGSAVFSRDGTLLGIISGVEQYEFDAGRRAVVRTLLGMDRFTIPKLRPGEARKT